MKTRPKKTGNSKGATSEPTKEMSLFHEHKWHLPVLFLAKTALREEAKLR